MSTQETGTVLDAIAGLLHERIGLRPESSVRGRLHRCATDAAAARAMTLGEYLDALRYGGDDLQDLVNRITVQETAFFRHPEQFDVLVRDVLPSLRPPVTIWSAGCANGQEAMSLAIVLAEQHLAGTVVATDLSTSAIRRTTSACYTDREITGLSAERRERHLRRTDAGWQVEAALRQRVVAVRHNLLDELPGAVRQSQVIFCRNILIYLSQRHTRDFLGRVADSFPVGTPLFLGAAELLWQVTDRFEPVRRGDSFFYRSVSATRTTAAAARPPVRAYVPPERPASARTAPVVPAAPTARAAPAARHVTAPAPTPPPPTAVQRLASAGQQATSAGDHRGAVVSFRAWAYLAPEDAMAHVHLGLALEAAGDLAAARRTYGVALRGLRAAERTTVEQANEGYSLDELLRLVEARQRAVAPEGAFR